VKLIRTFPQNNDYTAEFSAIERRIAIHREDGPPGLGEKSGRFTSYRHLFFILVLTRYVRDIQCSFSPYEGHKAHSILNDTSGAPWQT
jgi:hypothetical protein